MWSLYLGLIFCAVSFLPAYFDHGERQKAFRMAIGPKEKWLTGVKWMVLNWGLPVLAVSITVTQGLESASTDRELSKLRNQNQKVESKLQGRTITQKQRADFINLLSAAPKCPVIVGASNPTKETSEFRRAIVSLVSDTGYSVEEIINYGSTVTLTHSNNVPVNPSVAVMVNAEHQTPDVNERAPMLVNGFRLMGIETAFVGFKTVKQGDLKIETNQVMIYVLEKP